MLVETYCFCLFFSHTAKIPEITRKCSFSKRETCFVRNYVRTLSEILPRFAAILSQMLSDILPRFAQIFGHKSSSSSKTFLGQDLGQIWGNISDNIWDTIWDKIWDTISDTISDIIWDPVWD